jgi:hypothetical protein
MSAHMSVSGVNRTFTAVAARKIQEGASKKMVPPPPVTATDIAAIITVKAIRRSGNERAGRELPFQLFGTLLGRFVLPNSSVAYSGGPRCGAGALCCVMKRPRMKRPRR